MKLEDPNEYLVLKPFLFDEKIDKEEVKRIWEDVENALQIYFDDEDFQDDFYDPANQAFTQYPLRLKRQGVSMLGKPDLLLFFAKKPPLIVDWKVYKDSSQSHKLQLMTYAYMLHDQNPVPEKFPKNVRNYNIKEYAICEYQLLTGEKRLYDIDDQDVHDTEEFMNETIYRMKKKELPSPTCST